MGATFSFVARLFERKSPIASSSVKGGSSRVEQERGGGERGRARKRKWRFLLRFASTLPLATYAINRFSGDAEGQKGRERSQSTRISRTGGPFVPSFSFQFCLLPLVEPASRPGMHCDSTRLLLTGGRADSWPW